METKQSYKITKETKSVIYNNKVLNTPLYRVDFYDKVNKIMSQLWYETEEKADLFMKKFLSEKEVNKRLHSKELHYKAIKQCYKLNSNSHE